MVGKHVRMLEERLGVRLLNRTTRRQSLTDAGTNFLERARIVLAELDAAEELAAESRARPRGELRINAPVTFGAHSLAPLLPDYMAEHPDVTVRPTLNDRIVDLIDEGYDCVFRATPLKDSTLMARRLRPMALVACAAPDYLAQRGKPTHPADLATHECIGFAHTDLDWEWTFIGPEREEVTVPVRSRFSVNNGQALRGTALAGFGVILQAKELTAQDIEAGRLVTILPGWTSPSRPMHLLFAPDRRITPKLRSFIDFAVERFG